MAKTCRTCEFARLSWWCGYHMTHDPICILCDEHKPRETPLLVDALAEAAKLLLEKLHNIGDGMLFNLDILDARDILEKALTRHQEGVGDA